MTLLAPEIRLPPPFSLVTLREVGDAFAHAMRIAPEQGAGTIVYVGRFDLAEFAVVLEPDEPLRTARRAFYAGMVALSDAVIAFAPPETPMEIGWPDTLRVNLGLVDRSDIDDLAGLFLPVGHQPRQVAGVQVGVADLAV